ncbi:MAG: ATP-dependent sacrificial sulfur transferase LarE [Candidatus Aminicenantes bacterium]|nr:ATP-dependent sacrificial sulfur transferase LarE [Candidatus Aminicenantes bacterium]
MKKKLKRKNEKGKEKIKLNKSKSILSKIAMVKYQRLKKTLASMPGAVVAFSGGVDSTFLLRVASEVLKDKVLAVVASSLTYPQDEVQQALNLAREMEVRVRLIETKEVANPIFSANPPDRCYYCKQELFAQLKKIALEENFPFILDGTNYDDRQDYRPGLKAAKEWGVRSPLAEVKLKKEEIRELSRWLGLTTWDKPSMACLASRFPYFMEIKPERLEKVAKAENFLRQAGFKQVRVRHQSDELVRIEILPEQFPLIINPATRENLVNQLKSLGYIYITFDLEGYRQGSLNLLLKKVK